MIDFIGASVVSPGSISGGDTSSTSVGSQTQINGGGCVSIKHADPSAVTIPRALRGQLKVPLIFIYHHKRVTLLVEFSSLCEKMKRGRSARDDQLPTDTENPLRSRGQQERTSESENNRCVFMRTLMPIHFLPLIQFEVPDGGLEHIPAVTNLLWR